MEGSNLFTNFYVIADWLYKLLFANLIWFVFNLPVVFLLINLLLAEEIMVISTLLFMIMVLLPFIFFPSTFSLFSLVLHFINKEEINILKEFLAYFKENYKKNMKIGLLSSLFWTILLIDFIYAVQLGNDYLFYLFILLGFFGLIYQLILFCTVTYLRGTILQLIKNSAILMLRQPVLSMSLGLISGVLVIISSQWFIFLFPLFAGSTIAFLSFLVFLNIFNKIKQ